MQTVFKCKRRSAAYEADFIEVKELGGKVSARRAAE